ncbi:MAG: DEAD/DEAH box helicase [Sulfuritalea sp.]|nr:DEAD/DEAH box helicase [Sulfuritalea sp.]
MVFEFLRKKIPNVTSAYESLDPRGLVFATSDGYSAVEIYVDQLIELGQARRIDGDVLVEWRSIFELLDAEEHRDSIKLLGLPNQLDCAPSLASAGSLTDERFEIRITGWNSSSGGTIVDARYEGGGYIRVGEQSYLLPRTSWELCNSIASRADSRLRAENGSDNFIYWGRVRKLAEAAGAAMDDFLYRTVVLTPEKLNLSVHQLDVGGTKVVEIQPLFEDAPANWLDLFDGRNSVPDFYNIAVLGQGQLHVAVTPQVKRVLSEIKRFPNRRIAGKRAQVFLRNPYALLGGEAAEVVSPEDYERSLHDGGIGFYTFDFSVESDAIGNVLSLEVAISATRPGVIPACEYLQVNSPEELEKFIQEIQEKSDEGFPCFFWRGFEIELRGDTAEKLARLRETHSRWQSPTPQITVGDVFEFSQYSQRLLDIGERKPYYSPFIVKQTKDSPWVPGDAVVVISETEPSSEAPVPVQVSLKTEDDLGRFEAAVDQAAKQGDSEFTYPGLPTPIKVSEAREIVQVARAALCAIENGERPAHLQEVSAKRRVAPIIKINLEHQDYLEGTYDEIRSQRLSFDKTSPATPNLPGSLIGELKDHQKTGVAWLQHLWSATSKYCSGCLVADDMGLGKTLQLLTFIAWYLQKPDAKPVLIVAPVSLLENWQREMEKFFAPGFARVLTLYGEVLASKKVARPLIDQALLDQGMTRFLEAGWMDGANLVLTTYETMRDLSISLGTQTWGIMVCDEAQKIKTPGTLVTDAAKVQKALFKIACTGTPVENSLTDLWCLFDFVQPGLLGPLNVFGTKYRRPIEMRDGDQAQIEALKDLKAIVEPQILRRTKQELAIDLPRKIEFNIEQPELVRIPVSSEQRRMYNQIVQQYKQAAQTTSPSGKRLNPILGMLHRLRTVCADPRPEGAQPDLTLPLDEYRRRSPKIDWLIRLLDSLSSRASGEKVLIFTEFLEMQRTLQHYVGQRYKLRPKIINGAVKTDSRAPESRQKYIDEFQSHSGFNVLILSPIAAGFGLNIQAANHVIHFTRPWNPAKEDQATDRAYRIGQTRDVSVYCPTIVAEDFLTFEEKLDQLLSQKRGLANDMYNGTFDVAAEEFEDLLNVQ